MMRKVYFNFICVYTLIVLVCTHCMEIIPINIDVWEKYYHNYIFIYYNNLQIFMVVNLLNICGFIFLFDMT